MTNEEINAENAAYYAAKAAEYEAERIGQGRIEAAEYEYERLKEDGMLPEPDWRDDPAEYCDGFDLDPEVNKNGWVSIRDVEL